MHSTTKPFKTLRTIAFLLAPIFALALTAVAATVTVTTTPTVGPPTSSLTVSGSGFPDSTAVQIYFDETNLALAVTNSTGSFSGIAILVPSSAIPGTHYVTAIAEGTTGTAGQAEFTVQTNWSQFRYDPLHRGRNPYENVLGSTNVAGIDLDWSYTTGGALTSSPAVSANIVYFGSADDNVYAINATTGAKVWSFATGASIVDSSPAVVNGIVYIGSTDKSVYALNATTGAKMWSFATGAAINSSPTVVNGVVYIGSTDKSVYALNATTGAKNWSFATNGEVLSSPAVSQGVVYVGSYDDSLYALKDNGTSVTKLWSYATAGEIFSSPAVSEGLVYVGSDDDNVYAIDAKSGLEIWKFPATNKVESSPTVYGGDLYIGSDAGYFYALESRNGTQIWDTTSTTAFEASPSCMANGIQYVGIGNNVYALEQIVTADILWVGDTGNLVTAAPTVVNGQVFVASQDDTLYAFDLTGSTQAQMPPPRPDPAKLRPDPTLVPTKSK